MSSGPQIRLNPALPIAELKRTFARQKWLHIPDVLEEAAAKRIHQCLTREIAWNITYNDDQGGQDIFASQRPNMTPADWQNIRQTVRRRAREGKFQYFYANFAVADAYKQNLIKDLYVSRLFEFVNSEPFLQVMREITGFPTIAFADQQATAYGPGHFLTEHNDVEPKKGRKAAYIFNFTPEWRPDWGGLLQLINGDSKIIQGLVPAFNALNIFVVPTRHLVTQVANFAPRPRYSLTGWLLERSGE